MSLPLSFDPSGGELSRRAFTLAGWGDLEEPRSDGAPALREQRAADLGFLPNLEALRALQTFGVDAPDLSSRLERSLTVALSRLESRQYPDGSWGWWLTSDTAPVGDPYLTAYILFGLARARQDGVAISEESLQKAAEYLKGSLTVPGPTGEIQINDRMVFIQFALNQAGYGDLPAC